MRYLGGGVGHRGQGVSLEASRQAAARVERTAHAEDGRGIHDVAHMDSESSRRGAQDDLGDVHDEAAGMELDGELEVKDTDVESEGRYDDDDAAQDALQDKPEETLEHHGELDWDEDDDQFEEPGDGLSDDDGERSGAEDDNQMAPSGGPEDSDDEDLYYNDPYADLGFNTL